MEWIHVVLLLGLGAALLFVLVMMFKGKPKPQTQEEVPVDLSSLTVRDARVGDIVNIFGAGADFEDLSFRVDEVHRYEWGSESWKELEGASAGGRVFLEWSDDDGLEVVLTPPGNSLRIQQLGLSEEELIRFDEEQAASNTVTHEGVTFHYVSSHETGFFEGGRGEGEGFYLWNFESDDGKRVLSIEKWEGEAFEASISTVIDPTDLQILRA